MAEFRNSLLILRFIPDLSRGETRNVGLVLWTPHGLAWRMIPTQKFHCDNYSHDQWIEAIARYCNAKECGIHIAKHPSKWEQIPRTDPRFIDAISDKFTGGLQGSGRHSTTKTMAPNFKSLEEAARWLDEQHYTMVSHPKYRPIECSMSPMVAQETPQATD